MGLPEPLARELSAAIGRVNTLFLSLPESRRPRPDATRWRDLEDEVNEACNDGELTRALQAIRDWEQFAEEELS